MENVDNDNQVAELEKVDNNNPMTDLDRFKYLLETSLECKGFYDSAIDKQVQKRLDKKIKAELEKKALEEEKEKARVEEENRIKEMEKEINLLKAEIEYSKLLEESGFSSELLQFLANGVANREEMKRNIDIFKKLLDLELAKKIKEKVIENPPIPSKSDGTGNNNKLW